MHHHRFRWPAFAAIALVAGAASIASGINNATPRSLNGLPASDTLMGGFVVGLRGEGIGGGLSPSTRSWIGVLEVDSDDRRGNTNGFVPNHPALGGQLSVLAGSLSDFAPDGSVTPIAGGSSTHAMGVAGIALSNDATHTGASPRSRWTGSLSDDIANLFYASTKAVPDPTVPADWAQMTQSMTRLVVDLPNNVINASLWYNNFPTPGPGAAWSNTRPVVAADFTGNTYPGKMFDSAAFNYDKIIVLSAGNSGAAGIGIHADHYNGITVGALVDVAGQGMNDVRVAGYSGRGAIGAAGSERNGVHLVAPGSNITSVNWDFPGANPDFVNIGSGTSFAAPLVSGVASSLWSAGAQAAANNALTDKNDAFETNHRVIKSVLLNSARKISVGVEGGGAPVAWAPAATDFSDPNNRKVTRPLNDTVGAGEVDANEAWLQYREKNTTAPDGRTTVRFWETSTITPNTVSSSWDSNNPASDFAMAAGTRIWSLTATLTWDRHLQNPANAAMPLSNLDLFFRYSIDNGATWKNILTSASLRDNTEHIHLTDLPDYGLNTIYTIGVANAGLGAGIQNEPYALSVRFVIPVPGGTVVAIVAAAFGARRRR